LGTLTLDRGGWGCGVFGLDKDGEMFRGVGWISKD
jgi:hypothetical protein